MFNNKVYNKTTVNAVSGGIYKTFQESWFERFHVKSKRGDTLFGEISSQKIIQMIIIGDMEVIAEVINEKDLEEYINEEEV